MAFFDGNSSIALANTGLDTKRSMSVLLNYKSSVSTAALVAYLSETFELGFTLFVDAGILVMTIVPRNYEYPVIIPFPVAVGEWYSVAAIYDYNLAIAQLYINGVKVSEIPVPKVLVATHGPTCHIGGILGRWPLVGSMSCLQIYNKALSEKEVQDYLTNCPLRECVLILLFQKRKSFTL